MKGFLLLLLVGACACDGAATTSSSRSCQSIVDIVFLLDASNTGQPYFQAQKDFIKDVASAYLLSQSQSRAAVISYGFDPTQSFTFDQYTNVPAFNAAVQNIPLIGGEPRLDRSIGTVLSEFTTHPRAGVTAKIAIILNGGRTNGQRNTQNSLGTSMRALSYELVMVGVGPTVDRDEILGITGGDTQAAIFVNDVSELRSESIRNQIQAQTCPAVNECLNNPNPCDPNAICTDTPDSFTCTCRLGYEGDGKTCRDINECLTSSPCDVNANCQNTVGSFICSCRNGYTGSGLVCSDINECLTNPCHQNANCQNTIGSFSCSCRSGFSGDGLSCIDINECLTAPCHTQASCTNLPGAFRCTCNSGFIGDGKICTESLARCDSVVDLVFLIDASDNGQVIFEDQKNLVKSIADTFLVQRDSRAAVVAYANDPVVEDKLVEYTDVASFRAQVDKLQFIGGLARMDRSLGTLLSEFATSPRPGLTLAKIGVIINAGRTQGQRGTQNSLGNSIRALGQELIIIGIGDTVDQSELIGIGGGNTSKLFFAQSTSDLISSGAVERINREACPAINECETNPCHPRATCTDTPASYECTCNQGYQGNGVQCTDINECLTNPCSQFATCSNTPGSFVCTCRTGFTGDGFTCTDVNECLTNPCSQFATCTNTVGSFQCRCNTGYQGTGLICTDINECLNNPCSQFATCSNTQGSFQCNCITGYQGNGIVCQDINECLTNPCSQFATCSNTAGSFQCNCRTGFTGNGLTCQDINECLTIPCHVNATCTNTVGSFGCSCKSGQRGDGFTCAVANVFCTYDIDLVFVIDSSDNARDIFGRQKELVKTIAHAFISHPRSRAAVVAYADNPVIEIDLATYKDQATFDAEMDKIQFIGGRSRVDRALGTGLSEFTTNPRGDINQIVVFLTAGPSDGQRSTQQSLGVSMRALGYKLYVKGLTTDVNKEELMEIAGGNNSYLFLPKSIDDLFGGAIIDAMVEDACPVVNECLTNPCDRNAICTDTEKSFTCQCRTGYTGDGKTCTDINECLTSPCHQFATCTNTPGSFQCRCNTGYQGNGLTCQDINECLANPCHQFATCVNVPGSFVCTCRQGFSGNGLTCTDINECLNNPCHQFATCSNTVGSFQCRCNTGYQGNGLVCTDINECLTNPCHQFATCTNTQGSFQCKCRPGFQGTGLVCSDINECLTSPCHQFGRCTNTPGSFQCACNTGYRGNGFQCVDINECLTSPCHQFANCRNTPGSFQCACRTGFSGNGLTCRDNNECLTKPCHEFATCTNTVGSYQCGCKIGYEGNGTFCMEMRYRDWGDWSVCSVTCGGLRTRSRNCTVSKIEYPHACPGAAEETRSCDDHCHLTTCPDHDAGQFFTFEDEHHSMVHGANRTWCLKSETPTVHTGPLHDHTFKSKCGHFLYFEASKCPPDAFGFIETPPQRPIAMQYCFQFYLSMYSNVFPDQMGSLTLYLFQYMQQTRQVFHHAGVTSKNRTHWRQVNVDLFLINSTMPFGIQFMAEQGSSVHSDIAVDDIAFTPGLCRGPVDGNWGQWSGYSGCNVTCGMGYHVKRRACNSPSVRNNGKPCAGSAESLKPCKMAQCKVNGTWTEWQQWGPCSIHCDKGRRSRFRECFNTRASRSDYVVCRKRDGTVSKEEEESMQCSSATCRPQGTLYDLTEWSKCSVTCDYGLRYRSGKCSVVDGCNGILTESKPCALQACHVNRQYEQWQEWSKCSTSCGSGKQHRKRHCPMVKGCQGDHTEVRACVDSKCHLDRCPRYRLGAVVYNFENNLKVVHTNPPTWKIGQNQTYSMRTGPNGDATWPKFPECGHYIYYEASRRPTGDSGLISTQLRSPVQLENCMTFALNMYSLHAEDMGSLTINLHQRGAPLRKLFHHKGVMKPNENKWKYINVDIVLEDLRPFSVVFKAERGRGYHSDISVDDIMLYNDLCDGPVDGEWSKWSKYGICSHTCGGGQQIRTRKCTSRNNGKACEGFATMTQECNVQLCPVNGSWCEWAEWNECTKSCGRGTRRRVRECTNPRPVAPGLECELPDGTRGISHEVVGPCNDKVCDVDGSWGSWKTTPCDVTCGDGKYTRIRYCDNPKPVGDGKHCPILADAGGIVITHRMKMQNETLSCNEKACP